MKKILFLILITVSLNSFSQNAFKGANTHAVKVDYETNIRSTFTEYSLIDLGYIDSVLETMGAAGTNRSVQFNNAGAFGGNDSLVWDASELRINIADSGGYKLQVGGSIFATSTITSKNSIFGASVVSRNNSINYSQLTLYSVGSGLYGGATQFRDRSNTYWGTIYADTLTADRAIKLPNKSGTIALVEDISTANTRWPGTYIESPTASDFVGLFYTPVAITITSVHSVLVGSSSPSVTFNLSFGSDLSSMTNVFTAGQTVTSTTTGLTSNSGFNDATIPANSWVKWSTSAMSGTVTAILITPIYTID